MEKIHSDWNLIVRSTKERRNYKNLTKNAWGMGFIIKVLGFLLSGFSFSLNKDEIIVFLDAFLWNKLVIRDKLFHQIKKQSALYCFVSSFFMCYGYF